MQPYPFAAPKSISEAEERILTTTYNVQNIESQLSDRNRTAVGGVRLDTKAYFAWRAKTITALKFQTAELRSLKTWLKATRTAQTLAAQKIDPANPKTLIAAGARLLQRLQAEVDLDPDEAAVVECFTLYQRAHGS